MLNITNFEKDSKLNAQVPVYLEEICINVCSSTRDSVDSGTMDAMMFAGTPASKSATSISSIGGKFIGESVKFLSVWATSKSGFKGASPPSISNIP